MKQAAEDASTTLKAVRAHRVRAQCQQVAVHLGIQRGQVMQAGPAAPQRFQGEARQGQFQQDALPQGLAQHAPAIRRQIQRRDPEQLLKQEPHSRMHMDGAT